MKTEEQVTIIKGRKYVPVGLVQPDLNQPRTTWSEAKLKEMAESIKANGIIHDLIVEPLDKPAGHYLLIDGERRLRAAKLAGLPVVPISERTDVNEKSRAVVQAVANQQHENLSALEEAAAYQRQIDKGWHTAETLYKALGISRATLFSRLALNRLTPTVREAVVAGTITASVAGLIASIPGAKDQAAALEEVIGDQWNPALSFREARNLIEGDYCKPLKGAPFDLERAYEGEVTLDDGDRPQADEKGWKMERGKWRLPLSARPSCAQCPFRSGNVEGLEPGNPNVCTRPRCYGAKCAAHAQMQTLRAEEAGKTVLPKNQSKGIFSHWNPTIPQGKYMDLGGTCYEDPKRRTFREILGKEAPAGVMAFNGNGKLQQVWEVGKVKDALKGKGVKVREQSTTDNYAQQEAKRQAEQKILAAVALKAVPSIRERLKKLPGAEAWRAVVKHVCNNWEFLKSKGVSGVSGLERKAKTMKEEELRQMALECAFSLHDPVESYYAQFEEGFQKAAALAGVDLKAMVAKEKASAKATTKNTKDTKKVKEAKK